MHFLGLAGMPRRIPDYADGYIYWNSFMTIGTFLTMISLLVLINTLLRKSVPSIRITNRKLVALELTIWILLLFVL